MDSSAKIVSDFLDFTLSLHAFYPPPIHKKKEKNIFFLAICKAQILRFGSLCLPSSSCPLLSWHRVPPSFPRRWQTTQGEVTGVSIWYLASVPYVIATHTHRHEHSLFLTVYGLIQHKNLQFLMRILKTDNQKTPNFYPSYCRNKT